MLLGVFAFDWAFLRLPEWGIRTYPQSMTLPVVLNVPYGPLAVAFGVLVLLMVAAADRLDPGKRYEPASIARAPLTRREWGFVSSGIPAGLGLLGRPAGVGGVSPGALAGALASGSFRHVPVTPLWDAAFASGLKSRAAAVFAGGFLIMSGALLGGGCTTGAFMAGFPTLSVGNFAMGMTFFGVGMAPAVALD